MESRATVLFGDKSVTVLQTMLEEANKYPGAYSKGLGFWKGQAEHAVEYTYSSWADAINAAVAIRAAGNQEAVLVILELYGKRYGILATADGLVDLGPGEIKPGLSADGSGFCYPSNANCWHFE